MEDGSHEANSNPVTETSAETAIEVVNAAVSAIPFAGGPLAAIVEGVLRRRQSSRLNKFLLDLSEDLSRLKEQLNEEFMRSEQAKDLFEDIVTKAAETRHQAKLEAFRAIFLNTILSARPNYDEATEISALIDGLQERHIVLLRILADPARAGLEAGRPVGEGGGIATSVRQLLKSLLPNWDNDQIDRTWQDLFDRQIHRTPGTVAMMTDSGIHQLENRLTPFGWMVIRYITQPS